MSGLIISGEMKRLNELNVLKSNMYRREGITRNISISLRMKNIERRK
jgi:hypothetical protein